MIDPSAQGAALAVEVQKAGQVCHGGTVLMDQPIALADRVSLMGGDLDPVPPAQVMAFIAKRVEKSGRGVIANHNIHSLCLARGNPAMRAFFQRADLIQIDSVPLILWGKILGRPLERAHRSTYLDWRDEFWTLASQRGWRVFLLGSKPGVVDTMIDRLKPQHPNVTIDGLHGYFDHRSESGENIAVIERINAFSPDVVLVGMGMPIQEVWIINNEAKLKSGVLLSVGGAFDYEAGVQIPSPRWIGQLGLEWLFRFIVQPRRLFARYFIEPWSLWRVAMDDVRNSFSTKPRPGSMVKAELSTPSDH